jgi:hypothetical protein
MLSSQLSMSINQNLKHCWHDVPEVERGQQHGDACVVGEGADSPCCLSLCVWLVRVLIPRVVRRCARLARALIPCGIYCCAWGWPLFPASFFASCLFGEHPVVRRCVLIPCVVYCFVSGWRARFPVFSFASCLFGKRLAGVISEGETMLKF